LKPCALVLEWLLRIYQKAIKTALANAKVKGVDNLVFKTIEINEGPAMKRFMAGTRGRAKPYEKRMSHIKVVLTEKETV